MYNKLFYSTIFYLQLLLLQAQVNNLQLPTSINDNGADPDPSAILDAQSQQQGVLIPRMNFSQIQDIVDPAEGLMVFDKEFGCLRIFYSGNWDCLYSKASSKFVDGDLTGWNVPYDGEADPVEFDINSQDQIVILGILGDGVSEYLATYDKSGNLIWASITEDIESRVMVVDDNDLIYLLGETTIGYAISKLDANGNIIWQKPIGYSGGSFFRSIELDDNGNIYIGGNHSGEITVGQTTHPNQGLQDCSIAKYDSDGNLLWLQSFGGSSYDRLANICVDSEENVYVLGNYSLDFSVDGQMISSSNTDDMYVLKFDSNGALDWFNSFEAEGSITTLDCQINSFDEFTFLAIIPDLFLYKQDEIELGTNNNNFLMAAIIRNNGDLIIKGKTELLSSVSRPYLTTANNGDFYVSIDMDNYTGSFGSINYQDCPGESYLIKYPYLNGSPIKAFEWAIPLPMIYRDIDYMNDGSIFLYGTLRNQALLGNTTLTKSHQFSAHNLAIVKYLE